MSHIVHLKKLVCSVKYVLSTCKTCEDVDRFLDNEPAGLDSSGLATSPFSDKHPRSPLSLKVLVFFHFCCWCLSMQISATKVTRQVRVKLLRPNN